MEKENWLIYWDRSRTIGNDRPTQPDIVLLDKKGATNFLSTLRNQPQQIQKN